MLPLEAVILQAITTENKILSVSGFLLKYRISFANKKVGKNKSKIEILEKKISDLQLSIAFAASSSKDMNEAKKRISKLIRDIDDCIGMLGE